MGAVRLIIPTSALANSHVHTFKNAAQTLKKDYQALQDKSEIKVIFASSGREIVSAINQQATKSIISLDIISHGNQGGIHIARALAQPAESGLLRSTLHVRIRRGEQSEEQARFMEESMHGLYTDWIAKRGVSYYYNQSYDNSRDIATLSDIKFDRFADDVFVEFHGCRTAEVLPIMNKYFRDNFAEAFSEKLSGEAIVVGHLTNSNPNISGGQGTSDYRHGRINVYSDGETVQQSVLRQRSQFKNSSTPLVAEPVN